MGLQRGIKESAWKVALYGKQGIGKSSLAALAPQSLVIDIEGGVDRIDCVKTDRVNSWAELFNMDKEKPGILNQLCRNGSYEGYEPKTVVIDTLTEVCKLLEPICIADYKANCDKPKEWKALSEIPYGNGPGILKNYLALLVDVCDALKKRNINTILVCHDVAETTKNPMGDDYDRFTIDVAKKARDVIIDRCDALFFCMLDMHIVDKEKKFGAAEKRAVSGSKRIMKTIGRADYDAKNRFGLEDEVPMTPEIWSMIK